MNPVVMLPTYNEAENVRELIAAIHRAAPAAHVLVVDDDSPDGTWRCAQDLAADGVVYAEVRFAPELHVEQGLSLDGVVDAVLAGFHDGETAAAAAGHPIRVRALLTAMRTAARSREIAELVVRYRDRGVVGFDIAGAEAGFPPSRHQDAFDYLRGESCHITIHAGEAFGLPSLHEAVAFCGCARLGHGVRIAADLSLIPLTEPTRLPRLSYAVLCL